MMSEASSLSRSAPGRLLLAAIVLAVIAAALWFLAIRDSDPKPNLHGEVGSEAAPVVEEDAVAEPRDLVEMQELGYIVDEEPESPDDTSKDGFGEGRIAARRYQHLAVSMADSGDLVGAEDAFRKAIAADPSYRPPHYALAELLRRTNRFDEADREFWTSVDIGLGEPTMAIVKVATQYRNQGELERAGRILDEGRRRHPDSADIWLHYGALFGEVGDLVRSARALEKAVSLAPNDPLGYRNLAAAQVALGDREQAARTLERGLQCDPQNRFIKEMIAQLTDSREP